MNICKKLSPECNTFHVGKSSFHHFQTSFIGSHLAGILQIRLRVNGTQRRVPLFLCIKCEKKGSFFE